MTTVLKRFSQAYATMTVAAYEPIIYTRWVSLVRLKQLADIAASRAKAQRRPAVLPEYHAMAMATREGRSAAMVSATGRTSDATRDEDNSYAAGRDAEATLERHSMLERMKALGAERVALEGFPDAVSINGRIFPRGIDLSALSGAKAASAESAAAGMRKPAAGGPARVNIGRVPGTAAGLGAGGRSGRGTPGPLPVSFNRMADASEVTGTQLLNVRGMLFDTMVINAKAAVQAKVPMDGQLLQLVMTLPDPALWVPGMWGVTPEELLSPIGIAHYYRQLYFNLEEGIGPIEEALTVAPLETLEVVYETTRRQIHEDQLEMGSETISEAATEQKNLDEVSDKVSAMIQRDTSASMSIEGGAAVGVYNFSASASASMAVSSQRSREESSRRMREVTTRASERITKSFTIKTRDLTESSDRAMTRRVIRNESAEPVSYGLRRVLRRVRVKLQVLGPKLVWQLYVRDPGAGLRTSRFVHFREAEDVAVPDVPPGLPPRPLGGTDSGTTSSSLQYDYERDTVFVTVVINASPDRVVTAVSIDSITDLAGGGKDDLAPSPRNGVQWGQTTSGSTFTVNIGVVPGDSESVTVNYTYTYDPAGPVMEAWEALRVAAVAALTAEKLQAKFEQDRTLLTMRSKIRPRAANDLRREERYEIMNRMVSRLFASPTGTTPPTPLEIESFHRYFDIEGMFVTTHPSWWRPRYTPNGTFASEPYPITAESEPAPLGSSLGWMMQLDGDARRNEFLNSPWARICIPMRPNTERRALSWLAKHLEGEIGYDPQSDPLRELLASIEALRQRQGQAGLDGPEWVQVDSAVDDPGAPADPLTPEGTYPVVHEFDVTVPTDGFVYEALEIDGA